MRTIESTVYTFDELDDSAKERARDWWRELEALDFDAECVIEDAQRMAEILGIEFDTRPVKLMGGGVRRDPCVYWSGFSSQGDGACFEGRYRYAKGAAKAIRKEAPQDTRLHAIADDLQAVQRKAFYRLEARVRHTGRYYHEHSTSIDVEAGEDSYRDIGDKGEAIAEALREFMRWIYRHLEQEYTYIMSDENVDESIRTNGYEFDENGACA